MSITKTHIIIGTIIIAVLIIILLLPKVIKNRLKPVALQIVTSIQFNLNTVEGKVKKQKALYEIKTALNLMVPGFLARMFVNMFITEKNLDNLIEWAYTTLKPDFNTEKENTNKIINNTLYLVDNILLDDNIEQDANFPELIKKIQENPLTQDFVYQNILT